MSNLKIEPLNSAPKFLRGMAGKVNDLVRAVRLLGRIQGDGAVNVKYSESNILITLGDLSERIQAGVAARVVRGSAAAGQTYSEIQTALQSAYSSAGVDPENGDLVELGDAGNVYLIRPDEDVSETTIPGQSGDDIDRVKVTVGGQTFTAYNVSAGAGDDEDPGRVIRGSVTTGGPPPTTTELRDAVLAVYSDTESVPHSGDVVLLSSPNSPGAWKFRYVINVDTFVGSASDELWFGINVDSISAVADGIQKGAW